MNTTAPTGRWAVPVAQVGYFGELWLFRELFFFLVWRDFKIRYKQTILGAAWAIIQPTFTMLIFTLFFGRLAKIPTEGIPYPLFSYAALLPWLYFATSVTMAGNSLVANVNLITKVYFPRVIVPGATVLSGVIDFFIASVVLVGLMAYYQVMPTWKIVLWPFLILPLVVLAFGVSLILSALNVRYRDFKYVIPFGIQMWLFLSPVIYPTSLVPERFRFLTALNPVTGIIEAFRSSLIPDRAIDWQLLSISLGVTAVIVLIGAYVFKKTERSFADVI